MANNVYSPLHLQHASIVAGIQQCFACGRCFAQFSAILVVPFILFGGRDIVPIDVVDTCDVPIKHLVESSCQREGRLYDPLGFALVLGC